MKFTSYWQYSLFVKTTEIIRRLLRPWPKAENRLIANLVAAQNRRVYNHLQGNPPQSILLILPRCLKKTTCRVDLQNSLSGCLSCSECQLGEIARLCAEFQVQALVAFRSHKAFAIARQEKPDVIIATACHDRLIKALRSVPEIPALLAPLKSMAKPCINANIDLEWLAEQLTRTGAVRINLPNCSTGEPNCPGIKQVAEGS